MALSSSCFRLNRIYTTPSSAKLSFKVLRRCIDTLYTNRNHCLRFSSKDVFSDFSHNQNISDEDDTYMPKRFVRRLQQLKSKRNEPLDTDRNSDVINRNEAYMNESEQMQEYVPKRISKRLKEKEHLDEKNLKAEKEERKRKIDTMLTETMNSQTSELPNFPSDMERFNNWYRTQSRKAFRPKVDPTLTSVLLFPGQGSQFVGMGKKLIGYPGVKEIYDTASEILRYDLLQLCLNGPQSELDKTVHCQPAVVVTSLAAIEKLREEKPEAIENCIGTAGFSVGEFTALVFSGALSLEDAMEVVKLRAEAMQQASEASPSGMMSVFTDHHSKLNFALHAAKEYCRQRLEMTSPVCQIANYLHPDCKVVAGHNQALDFVVKNAREFGIRRIKHLPVSGAFHTELMRPAKSRVVHLLQKVELQEPSIAVHSCVDGGRHRNIRSMVRSLGEQIFKPVKWEQIMHVLFSRKQGEKFPFSYEVGPGTQLGTLLKLVNATAHERYSKIEV